VLKTSADPVDVIEKEEQDRALNAGNISHDALEIVEDRNCGRGTRVEAS